MAVILVCVSTIFASSGCIRGTQYDKVSSGRGNSPSEQSPEAKAQQQIGKSTPPDLISMDAVIDNVMESWPLQLTLQTSTGKEQVALAKNTIIKRAGVGVDPGVLKPRQRVRAKIQTTNGDRIITELEILD